MIDDVEEFDQQYKIAKIVIFKYLELWFGQIFASPEYKDKFADKPTMHTTMAAEVMRYLLVLENENQSNDSEELALAQKHSEKWASDAIDHDKDFCELIIQTLRMDIVYNQFVNGDNWLKESGRGKKISELLNKFGGKISKYPDPKTYERLIAKWMTWSNTVDNKIKKEREV